MTMSVVTSSYESRPQGQAPLQRATGRVRMTIDQVDGLSRLGRLFEEGAAKVRFPKVLVGSPPEAVIINTAGGLTGGDRFSLSADIGDGAAATLTSQACEKIYRSSGEAARIDNRLKLGEGAICAWLPQETILFNKARLERSLEVDMAEDATLLAVEPLILGRRAMGETVTAGRLRDRWRIRRAGRLLHADDLRLDGNIENLTHAAPLFAGCTCSATIVLAASNAEDHLDCARALLEKLDQATVQGGASAWHGRLVVRMLAESGMALRCVLIPLVRLLLERMTPEAGISPLLPRVWSI